MLPLILLLLLQGVLVPASQSGSITGVLTTATGKPAAGVRVSALTVPDSSVEARTASAMAGLSETDQNGVFKLENIAPGRYYIVAGRIDLPTYYPGTLDMIAGRDVRITPGAEITGVNFALKDNSTGRADTGPPVNMATSWMIPIRVTVEGSGRIPVFDSGLFPVIRFTRSSDGQRTETPLTTLSLVVPVAANPEYRVTIENLSQRYTLKSMKSGTANLLSDVLKLPSPSAPIPLAGASQGTPLSFTVAGQQTTRIEVVNGVISITNGTTTSMSGFSAFPVSIVPPLPPVPTLEVTLAETAATAPRSGATLSGTIDAPLGRSIEVSGIAGTIYKDGTFEVRDVPTGRQVVLTVTNPTGARPVGASIIVGAEDIRNLRLQTILEIPRDFDARIAATLGGTFSPGTVVPLAKIRGHLVEASTGQRFNLDRSAGRITVNGNTVSYTINNVGDFEIQGLLPGRYDLELEAADGKTYSRSVDVRDADLTLEWPVPAIGLPSQEQ